MASFSVIFLHLRFQKTFRHFLQAHIRVGSEPYRLLEIEFQFSVFGGEVITLADIDDTNRARAMFAFPPILSTCLLRCRDGEPNGVPWPLCWRPWTTGGIAQVAEGLDNMLGRDFILVLRSGAVAGPSAAQRKALRMGPAAIFESLQRHEIGAGHVIPRKLSEWWRSVIVISYVRSDQLSSEFV